MSEPEKAEFSFVMPFVCCVSEGGTMDDRSFVAGVNFGAHEAALASKPYLWEAHVKPEMVPMYDLLAMTFGYKMRSEPPHDGWVLVTMVRLPWPEVAA